MPRARTSDSDLREKILDPLRNFKHESVQVEEWEGATVVIRALSAGDWLEYRRRALEQVRQARVAAGLSAQPPVVDGKDQPEEPLIEVFSVPLYAFVLARTLFELSGRRLFGDDDVDELVEAFSPVHDRLVAKAFELSGVSAEADSPDPVDMAGNA
ncbi:phage tail assembly chaperone [Pseudomonas sp. OV546]|uniref:phage tail assembly chaperone n=1 Tax=Pseudomonas sp. OV546 TaxID=1881063 RepID=UPI0008F00AE1|nr:phage tail assembly chaperone [Pseudomonas sp. OV546]SFU95225.1 Phage tail assembly chaperone [Pseudomonas sp. OV546]